MTDAPDEFALQKAKQRMLELLIAFDKICRKHKLKYWIDYGTLLGAVRHSGFIPWDDDIDVSMPRQDFTRLTEIIENELPPNAVWQSKKTDPELARNLFRLRDTNTEIIRDINEGVYRGVFIDVFPTDQIKKKHVRLAKLLKHYYSIDPFKPEYSSFRRRLLHIALSPVLLFKPLITYLKNNFLVDSDGTMLILNVEFNLPGCYQKKHTDELIELSFEGHRFLAPKHYHELLTELYGDYMTPPPEHQRIPRHHSKIIFHGTQS